MRANPLRRPPLIMVLIVPLLLLVLLLQLLLLLLLLLRLRSQMVGVMVNGRALGDGAHLGRRIATGVTGVLLLLTKQPLVSMMRLRDNNRRPLRDTPRLRIRRLRAGQLPRGSSNPPTDSTNINRGTLPCIHLLLLLLLSSRRWLMEHVLLLL